MKTIKEIPQNYQFHDIGDVIRGGDENKNYEIVDVLGYGGTAITFSALLGERKVAIKALPLRNVEKWNEIERFQKEAMTLRNLNHPGIAKYIDSFDVEIENYGKVFYLVQELIEGENLQNLIDKKHKFSEEDIIKIAQELLQIIIYLHSLSPAVIHRDIKPQNIIMKNNKTLSLIDFGAVQDYYRTTVNFGTITGTIEFMPMEQLLGKSEPRTDLYSLGLTLACLYTHKTVTTLERKDHEFTMIEIPNESNLKTFLKKLTRGNPQQRYSSAENALKNVGQQYILFENMDDAAEILKNGDSTSALYEIADDYQSVVKNKMSGVTDFDLSEISKLNLDADKYGKKAIINYFYPEYIHDIKSFFLGVDDKKHKEYSDLLNSMDSSEIETLRHEREETIFKYIKNTGLILLGLFTLYISLKIMMFIGDFLKNLFN